MYTTDTLLDSSYTAAIPIPFYFRDNDVKIYLKSTGDILVKFVKEGDEDKDDGKNFKTFTNNENVFKYSSKKEPIILLKTLSDEPIQVHIEIEKIEENSNSVINETINHEIFNYKDVLDNETLGEIGTVNLNSKFNGTRLSTLGEMHDAYSQHTQNYHMLNDTATSDKKDDNWFGIPKNWVIIGVTLLILFFLFKSMNPGKSSSKPVNTFLA